MLKYSKYLERRRMLAGALSLVAAMALSVDVSAQENLEFDAQTFRPAAGPYSIFTQDTSEVLKNLEASGAVILNYASRPLVLERPGDQDDIALLDQQLAMHVVAGIGFFDIMQLDLGLPVYFINDSAVSDTEIQGGVVGDLSLTPKFTLLSRDTLPVGLGIRANVTLPTGREQALVGAGTLSVAPALIVDTQIANVVLTTNLGVRILEDRPVRNLNAGDRFEYGAGAEASFLSGLLKVGGELYGSTQLGEFFADKREAPLEGILGAKIVSDTGFSVFGGAGGGLVSGVGAPEFRAFLGLRYAFVEREEAPEGDRDEDGIVDSRDECPDEPGPVSNNGCPVMDTDGDGVPDDVDQCADEPGPASNNGCPIGDADGDGVPDDVDQCVDEPGPASNNGCPIGDADGDGVPDDADQCPEEAGPASNNGCPISDRDGDGVADDVDKCPDIAGSPTAQGCPDADFDGIPDDEDKCPDKPGLREDDGCPPKDVKVVREAEEIKILEMVYFDLGKATLKSESFNLLQQVALVIRSNPDITKVEIAGHTDQVGPADTNLVLSQERADAVKTYLIEQGQIAGERLNAKGYGESQPLVQEDGQKAQAKNRRVEFKILEQSLPAE